MKNEMKNSKHSNSARHTIAARLKTFPALISSVAAQSSANTVKQHRSTGSLHHITDIGYPRTGPARSEMVTSVGGTSTVNSRLRTKFNRHSTQLAYRSTQGASAAQRCLPGYRSGSFSRMAGPEVSPEAPLVCIVLGAQPALLSVPPAWILLTAPFMIFEGSDPLEGFLAVLAQEGLGSGVYHHVVLQFGP